MIEPNTRIEHANARIHVTNVQPAMHADGTAYLAVQFFQEPGPCPTSCPLGHPAVVITEQPNPEHEKDPTAPATITVENQQWVTPDGSPWPRCLTCGGDTNPAVDSPFRTPDVIKDALWVPASTTPIELPAMILAKVAARRNEERRVAIDGGLVSIDPTHAAKVVERQLVTGEAFETVRVAIHEAGFAGQTAPPREMTLLVPIDAPLADAVRECCVKVIQNLE